MKRFTLLAPMAVATVALAPGLMTEPQDVSIETVKVAGPVSMLIGRGGNIGVCAGEDGLFVIDSQFADIADKNQAALEAFGQGEVEYLLNTHWHGDHTGGNAQLASGAPIFAHTNVRDRMVKARRASSEAFPTVTYEDGLTLHLNGETIRVQHYSNSHTDGDSVVFFEEANAVHMGDLFFAGRYPFIDLNSGGDVGRFVETITELLEVIPEDAKIIPGHGPLSSYSDLEEYHEMLETTIGLIQEQIDDGKSKDDIKSRGMPDVYRDWGSGFINEDRWIDIVHESLTR